MPIYEFYCPDCNTLFNFFAKSVNTDKRPLCPRCQKKKLERQVSLFAATGRAVEGERGDDLPIDEKRMEKAIESLAGEAERMNAEDPRAAADMMRKFTKMTGMELGPGMQEALNRMEAGEDPEMVEAEMGGRLEKEEPFLMPDAGGARPRPRRPAPTRDPKLYDL